MHFKHNNNDDFKSLRSDKTSVHYQLVILRKQQVF